MENLGLTSIVTTSLLGLNCLLGILCLSAIWFYSYAIYGVLDLFRSSPPTDPTFHPPISILKPIRGLDGDAYENLASFCRQTYPTYQLIFAVQDPNDPGIQVVQSIIDHFPTVDIQLVISDRTIGTNLKVSNLANALVKAKHELLLIADSDIRVGPDYLLRVVQPLHDPDVGVVTCLYRSRTQGWVAMLEALGTATEFHAGALVARKLEGMKFAFGSTILIRRSVLDTIGGFAAIADYLADDFQLGSLPAQAGYTVVLSDYVVDHVLAHSTVADTLKHQIRWGRSTRISRPMGYLGLIFTYGTVTSLLFLLATGGSYLGWLALIIVWSIRLTTAWLIGAYYLRDAAAQQFLWLVPVRDLIGFAIWCYSLVGDRIEWRGRQLKLTKSGKLISLESPANSSTPDGAV